MKLDNKESGVLSGVLQLLALRGFPGFRVNSGAIKQGKNFIRLAPTGTSDVIAIVPGSGRMLAIECKRPGGKVREGQIEFLERVRECGGVGLLIDDLDVLSRVLATLDTYPGWTFTIAGESRHEHRDRDQD